MVRFKKKFGFFSRTCLSSRFRIFTRTILLTYVFDVNVVDNEIFLLKECSDFLHSKLEEQKVSSFLGILFQVNNFVYLKFFFKTSIKIETTNRNFFNFKNTQPEILTNIIDVSKTILHFNVYQGAFVCIDTCNHLIGTPILISFYLYNQNYIQPSLTKSNIENMITSESLKRRNIGNLPRSQKLYYSDEVLTPNFIFDFLNKAHIKLDDGREEGLLLSALKRLQFTIHHVFSILNVDENLIEKQLRIETSSHFIQQEFFKLDYKISSKWHIYIKGLDILTFFTDPVEYRVESIYNKGQSFLKDHKMDPETLFHKFEEYVNEKSESNLTILFSNNLVKKLEKLSNKSKLYLSKLQETNKHIHSPRKSEFLSLFKFVLLKEIFVYNKESFSLFLINFLSKVFFHYLQESINAHEMHLQDDFLKLASLKEYVDWGLQKTEDLAIPRTFFKNVLFVEFLQQANLNLLFVKRNSNSIENFNAWIQKKFEADLLFHDVFIRDHNLYEEIKNFMYISEKTLFQIDDPIQKEAISDVLVAFLEGLSLVELEQRTIGSKNQNFIVADKDLIQEFIVPQTGFSGLPMFVPPNDWLFSNNDEDKTNIHRGGYLINTKYEYYPGITLRSDKSRVKLNMARLDACNYLQSIPYCINKKFLEDVLLNPSEYLTSFLNEKEENFPFLFRKNNSSNLFEQKPLAEFLEEAEKGSLFLTANLELDLLKNNSDVDKKKFIEKQIFNLRNKVINSYNKKQMQVFYFFNILFHAYLCSFFEPFFFTVYLDFRGRIYPVSSLLSPQGCNFSKSFLEHYYLQGTKNLIDLSTSKDEYALLQMEAWKKDYDSRDSTKAFKYLKAIRNCKTSLVEFDVTSSVLQIYSALTGNLQGLLLTNFLKYPSEKVGIKKDIYSYILKEFEDNFKASFLDSISKPFESYLQELKYNLFLDIFNSLNRSRIKNLIMCFLYSEGDRSRVDKLLSWVSYSDITIKLLKRQQEDSTIFSKFWYKEKKEKNAILQKNPNIEVGISAYDCCNKVAVLIPDVFGHLFPDINVLKNFLQKDFIKGSNIPTKQNIVLKISKESSEFVYPLLKEEVKKTSRWSASLGKPIFTNIYMQSAKFDSLKASSSICPNFIHHIDSEILSNSINKLKEKQVFISSSHDAYYSHIENRFLINEAYYNSFIEILLQEDSDPLSYFLLQNKSVLSTMDNNLTTRFKSNRQSIIKKLQKNELIMSEFILHP